MNTLRFTAGEPAVEITRITKRLWHALDDDQVTGRAEAVARPDGRVFLSVDAWHRSVFDQLARTLLAALPGPLHTVVDEADHELLDSWRQAGLTFQRREWEYLMPTGITEPSDPPPGVELVSPADGRLSELDRALRAEVDWAEMPAELLGQPVPGTARHTVAAEEGEYAGLIRVVQLTRLPRIGLIAVRAARHRRGIARALLTHELHVLRQAGVEAATAEVKEANDAATALFESVGAQRVASTVELVRHGG